MKICGEFSEPSEIEGCNWTLWPPTSWYYSILRTFKTNMEIKLLITEPQNGWYWKWPLEDIWPNPTLRAACPGLWPDSFWMLPWIFILLILPGQPMPVLSHLHMRKGFLMYSRTFQCFSFCLHWFCHCAPLERVWLPLLYTLPYRSKLIFHHKVTLLYPMAACHLVCVMSEGLYFLRF